MLSAVESIKQGLKEAVAHAQGQAGALPHDSDFAEAATLPFSAFVYVLGCDAPGGYRTYVGWTLDLDRRLTEHNSGTGAKSTRGRVWCLIYAEQLSSRNEAMSREWYLKRDRPMRRRLALSAQGQAF